jgi:hypothetical protein
LTDVSKPLKPEERREKNVLENIDINNYASEFYICPSNNTAINFKESFLIDQHKSITVKSVLRGHLWDKEKVIKTKLFPINSQMRIKLWQNG